MTRLESFFTESLAEPWRFPLGVYESSNLKLTVRAPLRWGRELLLSSGNVGWGLGILGSDYSDNGQVSFFTSNAWVVASTTEIPLKTWTHIALVRYNGVVSTYINGISSGTTYSGIVTDNSTSVLAVGNLKGAINSSFTFNGYIDEFRFSNGIARWTSNFTPPTSEYETQ